MTVPFQYPPSPLVRRHGPQGYAEYASFRPWLRDEFSFRCVYCLKRERWGLVRTEFDLDHFQPVCLNPSQAVVYENLLYSCASCNARKGQLSLPDPLTALIREAVRVSKSGRIKATTADARRIILLLGLDGPEYIEFRRLMIDIVALAWKHKPDLFRRLMGYPDELPNLRGLHPPGGNSRPEGIEACCHARRERGELPETY